MSDYSKLALLMSRGRIGFGLAALAAPGLVTRAMGNGSGSDGVAPVFARMLGARDAALGLGAIVAIDRGAPVRGWLEGAAMADAVDCIACLVGRGRMSPAASKGTAMLAGGAALIGVVLATRLDPAQPALPGQPEAVATGHDRH